MISPEVKKVLRRIYKINPSYKEKKNLWVKFYIRNTKRFGGYDCRVEEIYFYVGTYFYLSTDGFPLYFDSNLTNIKIKEQKKVVTYLWDCIPELIK